MKGRIIGLLTAILISICAASGQESFDKAEALFIYNFTRHIGWPVSSLNGEFVIGLVGDKSLYDELVSTTSGKSVGANLIVVKNFNSLTDISNCHILIIGAKFRSKSEDIKNSLGKSPTLLINSGDSRITKVAGIGFRMVEDKMKFEIYKNNIKNAGLVLSAQLEKMAIVLD